LHEEHHHFALVLATECPHDASMKLRRATPDDASAIAQLAVASYAQWTAVMGIAPAPAVAPYGEYLRDSKHWEGWVLPGQNGGLQASLLFNITPASFELWSVAVAPDAVGSGLGRQLMLFAEQRAREKGYREITLFTNIKMVANRAWYARLGYEETGRKNVEGRTAVTMMKRLDGTGTPPMTLASFAKRRAAYRTLHEAGCFVQPNPWDIGTARWLASKGFPALATTSAGFAWTRGLSDQDVTLAPMLAHIAEIVEAVPELPVNADFENGYSHDLATLAQNIKLCVATGVAGLSIEDATGDQAEPLYNFDVALERFKVARHAVNETGADVMLTARAEAFLHGHETPLREVCKRLAAFGEAGADVLYAPGLKTAHEMREVIAAAQGKPVNILVFTDLGLSVADIEKLGGRRISVGSALAKAAWAGFMDASEHLVEHGDFSQFPKNFPGSRLDGFFSKNQRKT
jgi:2-methylisocitrate lyase-like PEP mutase family enzyme/ribosomal protein S18 acetylase RimI-like enzyme